MESGNPPAASFRLVEFVLDSRYVRTCITYVCTSIYIRINIRLECNLYFSRRLLNRDRDVGLVEIERRGRRLSAFDRQTASRLEYEEKSRTERWCEVTGAATSRPNRAKYRIIADIGLSSVGSYAMYTYTYTYTYS